MNRAITRRQSVTLPVHAADTWTPAVPSGDRTWETDGDRGRGHDWESEGGSWEPCHDPATAPVADPMDVPMDVPTGVANAPASPRRTTS